MKRGGCMDLSTDAEARAMGLCRSRLQRMRRHAKAVRWFLVLALAGVCALLLACLPGTPEKRSSPPPPTTDRAAPLATVTPSQLQDVWARVRAEMPLQVQVYKPTFVPGRFGPPELLEVLNVDHGPRYTVAYKAADELLVFALNDGQGTPGTLAPPDTREPIMVLDDVPGVLWTSSGTFLRQVSWQEHGQSYQVEVSSGPMTREELLRIAQTMVPVQPADVWAHVRAVIPTEVQVYKPTFIPDRFGAPELLEVRADDEHRPRYTVVYRGTGIELLVFILNNGKGALGTAAPPDSYEPITVHDSAQGTLMTSRGSPPLWVSWQEQGRSYQIKASQSMTRDELVRIAQSMAPVR